MLSTLRNFLSTLRSTGWSMLYFVRMVCRFDSKMSKRQWYGSWRLLVLVAKSKMMLTLSLNSLDAKHEN